MRKILFVCTGNVFRSVSAKYCLLKYLKDNKIKGYDVDSAGTVAKKEPIEFKTRAVLNELGVKRVVNHQKRLTKKMLEDSDIIIVMAKVHADFIKSNFNFTNFYYFNDLAIGQKISLKDAAEQKISKENRKAWEGYIDKTIKYIYQYTPKIFQKIEKL